MAGRQEQSSEQPVVPPPASVTVDHTYKPVLYLPNGKVLVKRAGF